MLKLCLLNSERNHLSMVGIEAEIEMSVAAINHRIVQIAQNPGKQSLHTLPVLMSFRGFSCHPYCFPNSPCQKTCLELRHSN